MPDQGPSGVALGYAILVAFGTVAGALTALLLSRSPWLGAAWGWLVGFAVTLIGSWRVEA